MIGGRDSKNFQMINKMKLIDTHAHLDFPQFENDLDEVVQSAKKAEVYKIINIGCDHKRAKKAIEIAEKYDNIFAAVGLHPSDLDKESLEQNFAEIEKLAIHPKVVAIGECGFDFFHKDHSCYPLQKKALEMQVNLAKKLQLPVIIHLRDCKTKALEFLKENHHFKFVIHCFSEDLDFANEIINLGGMISFTGIVTFPNAQKVQEVAKEIPLEKIMLETDSPFLAPQKYRGQRCEPGFTLEVAKKIAELKNISIEEVAEVTTKNAKVFFGI